MNQRVRNYAEVITAVAIVKMVYGGEMVSEKIWMSGKLRSQSLLCCLF